MPSPRDLRDEDMSEVAYDRPGDDLSGRGFYLDVPAWGFHVFDAERAGGRG